MPFLTVPPLLGREIIQVPMATGDGRRVLAVMSSAFGRGQIVGPSFAGALYDALGSFTVPAMVAAGALVLAAALARR